AARGRGDVHLLDQGVFQALWSIGLDAPDGAIPKMGRLLKTLAPVPDLVVVLEAGPGTIARRLRDRGGSESRADHWDPEDAGALARSARLLEEVKAVLQDCRVAPDGPGVLLLPNDEDDALETNALRLAREIRRLRVQGTA
ncbi:MAG TPA: hypothetical protein VFV36_04870, partial [Candidatus Methylomirabilis sp.]|nr:hypothetical protein [Candidatus Methylomirabilis sp.]